MMAIWAEISLFETNEQRFADQARTIKVNGWLSEVEMEEIKRKLSQERVEYQMTGSVGIRPDQQSNEGMCETERIEDGLDRLSWGSFARRKVCDTATEIQY